MEKRNNYSDDYREYSGRIDNYDILGAEQFIMLYRLGLRSAHKLLDVGCGPLRAGRLFIPYLNKNNYCGIDPNERAVRMAEDGEVGRYSEDGKKPRFIYSDMFEFSKFGEKFDFILVHSVFTCLTKREIVRCCEQLPDVMAPKCLVVGTFKEEQRDYNGGKLHSWPCIDFRTVGYTNGFIDSCAESNGLKCIFLNESNSLGQRWFVFYNDSYGDIDLWGLR